MRYLRKTVFILLVLAPLVPAYAAQAADNTNWKRLYIDYINDNPPDEPDRSSYSLIHIDDDDVPELWINYGRAFEGNDLCYVSDGELEILNFSQYGLSYIERQNLFITSGGRQDSFSDSVYHIQNGKFEQLHEGNYGVEDNTNVPLDAEGLAIYRYWWDGKEVSEKEYNQELSSVFDASKAADPDEISCGANEIISKIMDF